MPTLSSERRGGNSQRPNLLTSQVTPGNNAGLAVEKQEEAGIACKSHDRNVTTHHGKSNFFAIHTK